MFDFFRKTKHSPTSLAIPILMKLVVRPDRPSLGAAAAAQAGNLLRDALARNGKARIIAATGASQFDFLATLVREPGIDWPAVELFHLDEYVGLPATRPASFRRYLLDRLIGPAGIVRHHLLDGLGDLDEVRCQAGEALNAEPIDVAFVGIGENGHLAFNDPPADFTTTEPYLLVELDAACRRQQVGEGWFPTLDDVPRYALSVSVRQILKARVILCVVPDQRKAKAVRDTLEGPIGPEVPASILRTHPDVTLFLDEESSMFLDPRTLGS